MVIIQANGASFAELNQALRDAVESDCRITGCLGQRFLAAGMSDRNIAIEGIPGNALGAYLNGANITVYGNAQDAVGDTMNEGTIVIHGNIGDAPGYAMRGGAIFIEGNAGYRAGIHMKAYRDKVPVMVFAIIAAFFTFLGTVLQNDIVWELQDMFNQLMVLPNAIALIALSGFVVKCSMARGSKTKELLEEEL